MARSFPTVTPSKPIDTSPTALKALDIKPTSSPQAPSSPTSTTPSLPSSPPSLPTPRRVYSQKRSPGFLLTLMLASATFGVTAWFAQATFSDNMSSRTKDIFKNVFQIDIGDTLTILALLSSVLTLLMRIILDNVLESVQWTLTGREKGLHITTILGLSPTTGALGTIGILVGKHSNTRDRAWSAFKLALRMSVWISGVVLFINTSVRVVYKSNFTYQVEAGIGPFNGAYVDSLIDWFRFQNQNASTYDVVPYTTLAHAYNLVVNPQHSITTDNVRCKAEDCDTYLLPGGLATSYPWGPTNMTNNPVTILRSVPGNQIEFEDAVNGDQEPEEADCDLFYQHPYTIAIRFCVASSRLEPGSIWAGVYVCTDGTVNTTCLSHPFQPNLTTTFSVFVRTSDLIVSRSNHSIISVTSPTPPIQDLTLDVGAYRSALRWVLNFTAAGIPAPSSFAQYFWSSPRHMMDEYWSASARQAFHSVLAYPLWFFTENNAGNIALLLDREEQREGIGGGEVVLSKEFKTTAEVAQPFTRIAVNTSMFVVFVVLQALVLFVAWTTLVVLWTTDARLLRTSLYPLVDFTYKTKDIHYNEPVAERGIICLTEATNAGSEDIRLSAQGWILGLREAVESALPLRKEMKEWFGVKERKQDAAKVPIKTTASKATAVSP